MIDFSKLQSLTIPEGEVSKIEVDGKVLWEAFKYRYVSLGDSIAAGHAIDDAWEKDYNSYSQYRSRTEIKDYGTYWEIFHPELMKKGYVEKTINSKGKEEYYYIRTTPFTEIVPNTYTDLISTDLKVRYEGKVSTKSFARSGARVKHPSGDERSLIDILNDDAVKTALSAADLVTVCIGANDVLEPALAQIGNYINYGNPMLAELGDIIDNNLNILRVSGYKDLFDDLKTINPKAKYIFTTIYNPYKYLWLDEGKDGFLRDILNAIPQLTILGFEVDKLIKESLLNTDIVKKVYDRVNGLADWVEGYVNKLNQVIIEAVSGYNNPNFVIVDAKTVFESFPDRAIPATVHYNDLVNTQFTRGYSVGEMHYGRMWAGSDALTFYTKLATKHISTSGFDIEGFAIEWCALLVEKVIVPDLDPHPRTYGQYVLKRVFAEAAGLQALHRYTITYDAYGDSSTTFSQHVCGIGDVPAFATLWSSTFTPPATGYYFTGWKDGNGNSYSAGQAIPITSNITLYAQWSNMYTLTFKHSQGDVIQFDSGQTGPMECYALWIDGEEQADLGAFSNSARTYRLPYKTPIGVIAQVKEGSARSYVTVNGVKVASNSNDARWGFDLEGDTTVHFEWNQWMSGLSLQSYWNCYITTA
jgi:uncharacterized repeat protein (TIGR02543 family)